MSDSKDSLGDRMKGYEDTTRSYLLRRMPVIIRLDGKAFHTFTRCLKNYDNTMDKTPFSIKMHTVMSFTTVALVHQIQNAQIAYTQSDEISILLRDWDKHETEQWFDGNIQKIISVSASVATATFNHFFAEDVRKPESYEDYALFDSRVFNIPKDEVTNYFIWRQQDASRNSVQMLGRHYFSHKQLHQKNNSMIQDMLMKEHNINWNNIPTWMKRGSCAYPRPAGSDQGDPVWFDDEIPIFTADRNYIEKHVTIPESK